MTMIQRRYTRARVLCSLAMRQGTTTKRLVATNINEGGFLALSRAPLEAGALFSLTLELPSLAVIAADGGSCVTIPQIGFGVKFTEIGPQYRNYIAVAVKTAIRKGAVDEDQAPPLNQMILRGSIRVEPRIRIACEVQLEGDGFIQRGRVCDVSQRGTSVLATKPRSIGQEIRIIDLKKRFQAVAVVRNCVPLDGQWRLGMQLSSIFDEWIFK